MAIFHKEDSILEIQKKKAEKQKHFMTVGQQLAKLTLEVTKKEKIISTLGKEFTNTMLQISTMKKEIATLRKEHQ